MKEIKTGFIGHDKPCLWVKEEDGLYTDGAHEFELANSMAWNREKQCTEFIDSVQSIRFVKKDKDGEIKAGVTSEQVLCMLKHRHKILNEAFPCKENEEIINLFDQILSLLGDRVRDRIERDVMGDLKK